MADHRPSSTAERITVTYAGSQALLAAPLTPHFTTLLQEQLPLRNLHWRPSQATLDAAAARATQQGKSAHVSTSVVPGSTIRTIQALDVALKPLTDEIRRWRGDPGYFEQPVWLVFSIVPLFIFTSSYARTASTTAPLFAMRSDHGSAVFRSFTPNMHRQYPHRIPRGLAHPH